MASRKESALRGLTLDAASPAGTLSQLYILQSYMQQLAKEMDSGTELLPCDHIDFIGGVGLGGLAALMLGPLRMSLDQAIDAIHLLSVMVFNGVKTEGIDTPFDQQVLMNTIETILEEAQIDPTQNLTDLGRYSRCRGVVFAAPTVDLSRALPLRSYGQRKQCTVVETALATICSPSLFAACNIGRRKQGFCGSGNGLSSCCREVLKEIETTFDGEQRIACILHLGPGISESIAAPSSSSSSHVDIYLRDLATSCALHTTEISTQMYGVGAYTHLDVEHGVENATLSGWVDCYPDAVEASTRAYLQKPDVKRLLKVAAEFAHDRSSTITIGRLNKAAIKVTVMKPVPPVSPYFVLRKRAWKFMTDKLFDQDPGEQVVFVMSGLGGCGKSQMMAYFIQEYSSRYSHTFFIDASSVWTIRNNLEAAIRSLGPEHSQDTFEEALIYLQLHPGWLIVYDNLDDKTLPIVDFFPRCTHGTILLTTRNRDHGLLTSQRHWDLGPMTDEEGLETLFRAAHLDVPASTEGNHDAMSLVQELGALALALVQAGNYCYRKSYAGGAGNSGYTFRDYLEELKMAPNNLLDNSATTTLDRYEHSVNASLNLSYKALDETAKQFLHLCGYLDRSNIAVEMLKIGAELNFCDSEVVVDAAEQRPSEFNEALERLRRMFTRSRKAVILHIHDIILSLQSYSLVVPTMTQRSIILRFHPLVHSWSRNLPKKPEAEIYFSMAAQSVVSCTDEQNIQLNPLLVPHVQTLLSAGHRLHFRDRAAFATILFHTGHFSQSEEMCLDLRKETSSKCGNKHHDVVACIHQLSIIYQRQGRSVEARQTGIECLRLRRESGSDHRQTIQAMINLASMHYDLAEWEEGETLSREAVTRLRKLVGEDHQDTLMALSNQAVAYSRQGRPKEAQELTLRVLNAQRRLLGNEHPSTLRSMVNYGVACNELSNWNEGLTVTMEALDIQKRTLGLIHPETIGAMGNLVLSYSKLKRFAEAESLCMEALEASTKTLGEKHPRTAHIKENLAITYGRQGRLKEAETILQDILSAQQETRGKDHPDTLAAMSNLLVNYNHQCLWSKAEDMGTDLLTRRRRLLNEKHPLLAHTLSSLGITYLNQGRVEEAFLVTQEAYEMQDEVLGNGHEDTLETMRTLAVIYGRLGDHNSEERLESEIVEYRRKNPLTAGDADALETRSNLAATLFEQGRFQEALQLAMEVLGLQKQTLGESHPSTIQTTINTAGMFARCGQLRKALEVSREVTDRANHVLGASHPMTLVSMKNLAKVHIELREWGDAVPVLVHLLFLQRGTSHIPPIEVLDTLIELAKCYIFLQLRNELHTAVFEATEVAKEIEKTDDPEVNRLFSNLKKLQIAVRFVP